MDNFKLQQYHENCTAYQFHRWLKNNGYKIIKDNKLTDKEIKE